MNPLSFFVAGDPVGQPRTRACIRGKHAGMYDPGTADGWKTRAKVAFLNSAVGAKKPIFTGPLVVNLDFVFQRPKSHMGKKGVLPSAPEHHTGKPDADNLAKAVLDALTDAGAWEDDCKVVALSVVKIYGDTAGCQISIAEAK